MRNKLLYLTAGLSLFLASVGPVAADDGAALVCHHRGHSSATIGIVDRLPLSIDPGGKADGWPDYLRMTYLDDQGRYVTVYYDPNWQQRLHQVRCPLY